MQAEPVARLNGAQARLLAIATALAARPRTRCCSTSRPPGCPREARDGLAELLLRLRSLGLGIVLVEHDLRLVRAVADVVTVLDAGAVIAHGTPAAVARDPEVQRAYLGPPARKPSGVRRTS